MLQSEIEFNTAENEPSACWQYFKVANANVQQLAVGEVTFLAEEQKQVLRHMNRALQGQIFQGPRISVKTMSGKCEAEKRFFFGGYSQILDGGRCAVSMPITETTGLFSSAYRYLKKALPIIFELCF